MLELSGATATAHAPFRWPLLPLVAKEPVREGLDGVSMLMTCSSTSTRARRWVWGRWRAATAWQEGREGRVADGAADIDALQVVCRHVSVAATRVESDAYSAREEGVARVRALDHRRRWRRDVNDG